MRRRTALGSALTAQLGGSGKGHTIDVPHNDAPVPSTSVRAVTGGAGAAAPAYESGPQHREL